MICTNCKADKEPSEFYNFKKNRGGKDTYCKACRNKKNTEYIRNNPDIRKRTSLAWYRRNPEYARNKSLSKNYGITLDEYRALEAAQSFVCKICKTREDRRDLAVDHDHSTGAVRGLLCTNCNMGIGYFKDDPERLVEAAHYLRGDC